MKVNDTISVNPSKTTMGHVETPASSIFRRRVLEADSSERNVDALQLAFPTVKAGLGEYSKYAISLRTLFATILIVSGITMLTTFHAPAYAVFSLCFGGMLALGLFTRPVMFGAAVYYCITGALAVRAGVPDISLFSLMFGCLIFGIIGGGKYSCDNLIRSAIVRHRKNTEKSRKENYLGYKAFHNIM